MKRREFVIAVTLAALAVAGAIVAVVFAVSSDDHKMTTSYMYASEVFDDEELENFASDIYLATVHGDPYTRWLDDSGPGPGLQYTMFHATVRKVFKGNFQNGQEIIVSQMGGISPYNNKVEVMEGDELLRPGAYLLLTRHSPGGWEQITAEGQTDIRVSDVAQAQDIVNRRFTD